MLYIGADTGNENVYTFLKSKRSDQYFIRDSPRYICTLGKKPSGAQYYIDDVEEIKYMFEKMRATQGKRKRNRSYGDLKDLKV